jgi:hypothetical protein
MNYDQKDCQQFYVITPRFSDTFKHIKKSWRRWVQNNSIFLKLIAKQLNISGFNRQFNKNKQESHHRTFHLKSDSDSDKTDNESGKNVITWA